MSAYAQDQRSDSQTLSIERTFPRFTLAQRWEHAIFFICITALFLTGAPQKYQNSSWSQWILSSPDRLALIQQIHHIFALLLTAGAFYHLSRGIYLLARRRLPGDIFITWNDVLDAFQMLKYLLFISRKKPVFGKYNFEQKITYWFLFFGIGILILSGFVLWFPLQITRVLPGGIVPAAFLAHSNEAIVAVVFIVVWHFFHVHFHRLNLSMFTGRLSEAEMREHHPLEYQRLVDEQAVTENPVSESK